MSAGGSVKLPLQFRRRLTLTFVAAVGLASSSLAIGSYFVVDHQRQDAFTRRAENQASVVFALTQGEASASRLDALIEVARQRNGFDTLVIADAIVTSNPSITAEDIPVSLVASEQSQRSARTTVDGVPYRVIAGEVPNSGRRASIYLWFSEQSLQTSLDELRKVLVGGCVVVTLLSVIAAREVAIRTLAPIQSAAEAARLRAEGLLHTQLPHSNSDEFRAWAVYFNDVASALEGKLQELSAAHERERRFTADVAHDLRTPLGAMVSASSLLSEHVDDMPEAARRPAQILIHDVTRLRRLVTDLLEISRLDTQQETLRIEPMDVGELVNGVVRSTGAGDDVRVTIVGAPIVSTDRVRLERILFNLVDNAVSHGGRDVAIAVDASASALAVEVSDRGPGIPEEHLEDIFDRFHKVSASRTTEGSGLGLAIAARHTAILGGSLRAANRHGGGAKFDLHIPLSPVDTDELDASDETGADVVNTIQSVVS